MRYSIENTRSIFGVAPRKRGSKIELFWMVRLDAIPSDLQHKIKRQPTEFTSSDGDHS